MNPILYIPTLFITLNISKNNYSALDRFSVGVVYDAEHNTITEVRSFKYGHSLDKYSPNIK